MPDLYVPLDVNFQDDDRLLEVSAEAELLFVRGLALCKRLLNDGQVTWGQARRLGDKLTDWQKSAQELVDAGLWDETAAGFCVPSWAKHNRGAAEVRDAREAKSVGGSYGNHVRHHENRGVVNPDCEHCTDSDSDSHTDSGATSDATPHSSSEVETSVGSEDPPKKRPKKATQLPKSWQPNDKHAEIATELGVDIQHAEVQFRDHHTAKGSTFKDWDAAFRTWLRNAPQFGGKRTSQQPNGPGGVAL